jgi:SAM-dependent methyltransferase
MPAIAREIEQAIQDALSLRPAGERAGFAGRAAAIERLEAHVLDRLEALGDAGGLPPALRALAARAQSARDRLESTNERFLARLRARIAAGRYSPAGLRRAFARLAGPPGDQAAYDGLDGLIAGLLDAGELDEPQARLEPEMVFYQPTPARAILDLIERAGIGPGDVCYDLGAGLGHVVAMVAMLSGARARGVELEPAYCAYAARALRALGLTDAAIRHGDAREAPLEDGTVYFMYTPFRGALLRQVLSRLEAVARERPIRVCTYGPCTPEVAGAAATWLAPPDGPLGEHAVAVFRSR